MKTRNIFLFMAIMAELTICGCSNSNGDYASKASGTFNGTFIDQGRTLQGTTEISKQSDFTVIITMKAPSLDWTKTFAGVKAEDGGGEKVLFTSEKDKLSGTLDGNSLTVFFLDGAKFVGTKQ